MSASEQAVVFQCDGSDLVGVEHGAAVPHSVGVLIVVGGPQYRVGSHRQFVLMARRLAAAGYPVLRFDYRGMGDSAGAARTFDSVDADIRAAIDTLLERQPTVRVVVVLGLCDAASAALIYGAQDSRVGGLVLINPWVRTATSEARAVVRHYYWRRLWERGLWAKLVRGELGLRASLRDFGELLRRSRQRRDPSAGEPRPPFLERMEAGASSFVRPVLVVLSGRDLTAREFDDLCSSSPFWRDWLSRTPDQRRVRLEDADHTFSSRESLAAAVSCIVGWLTSVEAGIASAARSGS
ncbi:MAG TPA: hydrolase 1, exosortase A system-associated [Steroidobacteraceae bacterium]|nr:hydrolase 1, exosortase A system-associated [Steroidobacteraceae bacterium]